MWVDLPDFEVPRFSTERVKEKSVEGVDLRLVLPVRFHNESNVFGEEGKDDLFEGEEDV